MVNRLRATRVGVYTVRETPYENGRATKPCARCGRSRSVRLDRPTPPTCAECRLTDPDWGSVPFEALPVSDSNMDAFDEPFISASTLRRRARRQRSKEQQ